MAYMHGRVADFMCSDPCHRVRSDLFLDLFPVEQFDILKYLYLIFFNSLPLVLFTRCAPSPPLPLILVVLSCSTN